MLYCTVHLVTPVSCTKELPSTHSALCAILYRSLAIPNTFTQYQLSPICYIAQFTYSHQCPLPNTVTQYPLSTICSTLRSFGHTSMLFQTQLPSTHSPLYAILYRSLSDTILLYQTHLLNTHSPLYAILYCSLSHTFVLPDTFTQYPFFLICYTVQLPLSHYFAVPNTVTICLSICLSVCLSIYDPCTHTHTCSIDPAIVGSTSERLLSESSGVWPSHSI
jgi:hypothetical protein